MEQLTPNPIGAGSCWKIGFGMGSFTLEITQFHSPSLVAFEGRPVIGVAPNFTINLQAIADGTSIHYQLHPDIPALLRPLMAVVAPPYGRHDLARYFREMDSMLARD